MHLLNKKRHTGKRQIEQGIRSERVKTGNGKIRRCTDVRSIYAYAVWH